MNAHSLRLPLALGTLAALAIPAPAQRPSPIQSPTPSYLAPVDGQPVPVAVRRALTVHALAATTPLHMSLSIAPADRAGLEAFVASVSNPASPNYRKFLTPTQIGARFGVSDARLAAIKGYLTSQGMKVTLVAANRLNILFDGTAAQAERAFDTRLAVYRAVAQEPTDRTEFFAYDQAPSVPQSFASCIVSVGGLENSTRPVPRVALTAAQTRGVYGAAGLYASGYTGAGRTIGISNFDGYRLSNVPLYYTKNGLPTPPNGVGSNIQVVVCGTTAGPGTTHAEGDLDIQMVLGVVPLCNLKVYDGNDLIPVLTKEANDNLADIISESYGWELDSATASAAHNIHLSMSAQGITYMAASGDTGTNFTNGGHTYDYPDFEPEVLSVGGTKATVATDGTRATEVAWTGSGGGWSTFAADFNILPSWQKGNGVPTTINKRLVPDVSLNAASNGDGAYPFYYNGKLTTGYSGTSFACPVLAGLFGIAEQRLDALGYFGTGPKRFGRIQDLIYSQNGRSDVWYDVINGNNGSPTSNGTLPDGTTSVTKAGWDTVTGWGSIKLDGFVAALAATIPPPGYLPQTVGIYSGQGTLVGGGLSDLYTIDGSSYSVASTNTAGVGIVASTLATFNLPASATSATFKVTSAVPAGLDYRLSLYNVKLKKYDLIKNQTTAGGTIAFAVPVSLASYRATDGTVTALLRTIKSSGSSYTLNTDQFIATVP